MNTTNNFKAVKCTRCGELGHTQNECKDLNNKRLASLSGLNPYALNQKKEFVLSKFIFIPSKLRQGMDCEVIEIHNIKEFIRVLKKEFRNEDNFLTCYEDIDKIIDKLVGDKLIWRMEKQ